MHYKQTSSSSNVNSSLCLLERISIYKLYRPFRSPNIGDSKILGRGISSLPLGWFYAYFYINDRCNCIGQLGVLVITTLHVHHDFSPVLCKFCPHQAPEMNCNIVSPESNYLKQMKRISPRIQFYPFKLLSVIITESEAMEWLGTQRLSCGTYSSSHILNRSSLLPAPVLRLDQGSEMAIVGCFYTPSPATEN